MHIEKTGTGTEAVKVSFRSDVRAREDAPAIPELPVRGSESRRGGKHFPRANWNADSSARGETKDQLGSSGEKLPCWRICLSETSLRNGVASAVPRMITRLLRFSAFTSSLGLPVARLASRHPICSRERG